jgi:hypothetical protein
MSESSKADATKPDKAERPAPQMRSQIGWVPAIPEPFFLAFGRTRCDCGSTFWGRQRYREHYALAHVLGVQ